ncbi:hypothetical protein OXB_2446 [Bacillus sp. OxB-1]|uniref:hypothetical protein n=1 Tax=Bacillus sp. (strain OxB-1) TaxID=98228 RepID=UPI000581BB94|nr:hypothetical protein [Bacillus sp. OxB-1]BAQ10917.1 hypothetical protein OXB_2446 [Bacillus sp. OxB-1]
MGPIQLVIVIAAAMIIKNHFWEKDKRKPNGLRTLFEIVAVVAIILTLEHFFPFLR